jgi:hypothetical protein
MLVGTFASVLWLQGWRAAHPDLPAGYQITRAGLSSLSLALAIISSFGIMLLAKGAIPSSSLDGSRRK